MLEETRAREKSLIKDLAEARAEVQGHASQVDNLETACANANSTASALKAQADADARARAKEVDGLKQEHEKNRARWRRECDERDERIAALEAVIRDKDAERVQRVANTVSTRVKLHALMCSCRDLIMFRLSYPPTHSVTHSDDDYGRITGCN